MAVTHTEVYRPFRGGLARHPFRFFPLFLTELSVATKKKLPLVLLFGPVAIATIVVCFIVQAKFTLQEGLGGEAQSLQAQMAVTLASSMLEVRDLIIATNGIMSGFALLAMVWFGAGLICEDHRAKAHLLYFSRPLTRLDYFLGKLCVAGFFGAMAVLVPDLLICAMAVFTSPGWSFLREQGGVVWGSLSWGLLWVVTMGMLVLAVSSLAPKKVFAIVGFFGFVMITEMFVNIGVELGDVESLRYLSVVQNLGELGEWMLESGEVGVPDHIVKRLAGTGGFVLLSGLVIAWRLRRMELSA
jgi:ABC-type transport system involved in multi-copper enzyme maturation permease subunit